MPPEIIRIFQSELSVDLLKGRNTLLIGAPYIGKSEALRRLDVPITDDLTDVESDSAPESVIAIDSFYKASHQASASPSTALNELIESPKAYCFAIRPRALDWLLRHDEYDLSRDDINALDQILLLEYDPDDNQELIAAVEECWSILSGNKGGKGSGVTRTDVENGINRLRQPEYEFESKYLAETLGQYGPTLIPPLALYLSMQTSTSAIFSDGIVSTTRDFFSNFTLSELINRTKEPIQALLDDDSLQEVVLHLGKQIPVVGGVALIAWLYLRDSDAPVDEVFEGILEDKLTPPARTMIEAKLDLPPYTIENLRILAREENIDAIHRLCDQESRNLQEIRNQVTTFEEELEQVRTALTSIEEVTVPEKEYQGLVAASIRDAAYDLNNFETRLKQQEEELLLDEINPREIAYFGSEADEIVSVVEDESSNFALTTGNHGTGKTTATYIACRKLAARGYQIVGPNFAQPPTFIEHHFDEGDAGDVLIASYLKGFPRVETTRELEQLIKWAENGDRTVVLECRNSFYTYLQQQFSYIRSPEVRETLRDPLQIEFEPMATPGELERAIEGSVPQRLRVEDEVTSDFLADISDGNPEIAKLVLGMMKRVESVDTSGEFSVLELVWEDVESVFAEKSVVVDGNAIGGQVLRHVASLQGVSTDTLLTILGDRVQYNHLFEAAHYLRGYLDEELLVPESVDSSGIKMESRILTGDEEWYVSPEPYEIAIFYYKVLSEDRVGADAATFLRRGVDELVVDLATTVALVHRSPLGQTIPTLTSEATRGSISLLETVIQHEAPPKCVSDVLTRLVMVGGIPLPASIFKTNRQAILNGVDSGDLFGDDFNGASILVNLFGHLCVNHIRYDEDPDAVIDLIQTYDVEGLDCDEEIHVSRQALAAGIAQSVLELDSEKVREESLELFERRTEEILHTVPMFLREDVFSQIWGTSISNVAERDVEHTEEYAAQLLSYTKQIADNIEVINKQRAIAAVLARAGTGLRDGFDSPVTADRWMSWVFNQLHSEITDNLDKNREAYLLEFGSRWMTEAVTDSLFVSDTDRWCREYDQSLRGYIRDTSAIDDTERGNTLFQIYGGAGANVAFDISDPTSITEEFQRLRDVICRSAQEDWHGVPAADFVALCYTTLLIDLVTTNIPDEADPWFELVEDELQATLSNQPIRESAINRAATEAQLSDLMHEIFSEAIHQDEGAAYEVALEYHYERCYINFISRLVQDVATRPNLEIEVSYWLEFTARRLYQCAEQIGSSEPEKWVVSTIVGALYLVLDRPAPETGVQHLLDYIESEFSLELLDEFYRSIGHESISSFSLPALLVERQVRNLQSENESKGVDRLDTAIAAELLIEWTGWVIADRGTEGESWNRTQTALRSLMQSHPGLYEQIKIDLTKLLQNDS